MTFEVKDEGSAEIRLAELSEEALDEVVGGANIRPAGPQPGLPYPFPNTTWKNGASYRTGGKGSRK